MNEPDQSVWHFYVNIEFATSFVITFCFIVTSLFLLVPLGLVESIIKLYLG